MEAGVDIRIRACVAVLVALLLACAFAPAAPAKKKKKAASATTASVTAPLNSSESKTGSASCKGGTHVTGGGFAVSPAYDPASSTGTRTRVQTSRSSGKKAWEVGAGAEGAPLSAGSFTSFARCEKNALGKIVVAPGGSSTVTPSNSVTTDITCPPRTHVIHGDYGTDVPFSAANPLSSGLVIYQSQRTSPRVWTISAFNSSEAVTTTLVLSATCELDRGSSSVTSHSATVPVVNDARTTTTASCTKKEHPVSGGFQVTPLPVAMGTLAAINVDTSVPTSKGWSVGLYEAPTFNLPLGSALTAQVNCKKN